MYTVCVEWGFYNIMKSYFSSAYLLTLTTINPTIKQAHALPLAYLLILIAINTTIKRATHVMNGS